VFCLDTNVVIAILNGRDPKVLDRLEMELNAKARILIPTIVWFELRYGVAKSQAIERNKDRLRVFMLGVEGIPAFDTEDAAQAGEIRAHLEKQGTPIGPYDILIAAQTRRLGATLVSANTGEFSRIPGLNLVDWSV
jgi:tRNA(fMet)-specific endonuclease VapC